MNRRLFSTAAVTSAASFALLGAGSARAASSPALNQMMDTCIQQFVASNLADYHGKVSVRKEDSHSPPLVAGQSNYFITVAAVGKESGAQIASATCKMSHDGSVVYMTSTPIAALKPIRHIEAETVAKNEIE
jgi:hypothetical protein